MISIILDKKFNSNVPVMRGSLIGLMLFHQGNELLGAPPLGLEIIVVGGRGTSVHLSESEKDKYIVYVTHHEVD